MTKKKVIEQQSDNVHQVKKKSKRNNKIKFTFKLPRNYDRSIHFSMILLIIFGSMMIFSTSVGSTLSNNMVVLKTVFKQIVFIVVGYSGLLFFANNFSMRRASRYSNLFAMGIGILLVVCLFFYNADAGTRSWIVIPYLNVTVQPSEFVKVILIVLMAVAVQANQNRSFTLVDIVKTPVLFFIIFAGLIMLQPDMGTLMVISLICAICSLIPTHPSFKRYQRFVSISFVVVGMTAMLLFSPVGPKIVQSLPLSNYQEARFTAALNPFSDVRLTGYQLVESLYAFARGGVRGTGFGSSVQKFGYLPEAQTDYILAIVVEETGILGFILVVGTYLCIIGRLFYFAFKTRSEGYKIILIGTSMYMFIHFAFNVGGVTGLIPLTGVPLLFLSSGGSSLISIMIAIGICQHVISQVRKGTSTIETASLSDNKELKQN
ncbi:MAG: FtsW/RodA/SpoVE family cell cycle protein [Erysipelotrichaceae bacterium]